MMIGRSSIKNIAKSIFYPMSKKKLSQQWRKPIQQLRQQKEDNAPIHPDNDKNKKLARQFLQNQFKKHGGVQNLQDPSLKSKRFAKKHPQQQNATPQFLQKSSQPKAPQTNWLQLSQFSDSKQLTDLVNEALNMSRLKYQPQLKEALNTIKSKFNNEGLQYCLNALFKQNFLQTFDWFKNLDLEIGKLNHKVLNSIIFNLIQLDELNRLDTVLDQIKSSGVTVDVKQEEFFDLLFHKECTQSVKFQFGQNSVNIYAQNKALVHKIQLASKYLNIAEEQSKKKKGGKRVTIIPLWLNKVSKIVTQHRFGQNQFRSLLTQILTKHQYLIPETFYETDQFSLLLKQFFFGRQEHLNTVLGSLEGHFNKNVKFSNFYKNFSEQLMNHRIQTGSPAFEVTEELIEFYKKGFETHSKYLSIVCAVIASDAQYKDIARHYTKNYMIGFPNETLTSEDTKFVQQGIINNYQSLTDAQTHEKTLTRLTKTGSNLLIKLKSAIKLGDNTMAYKLFEEDVLKKVAIQRQRKNIEFVLRNQLGDKVSNFNKVKETQEFIDSLDDHYLWSLYERSEDVSVLLKKYIPEDKFSFWEEKEKADRFEQISKMYANGSLDKIKQPESDILATGFNLDEYIQNQFPQLLQLQNQQYEKQKQMIKYTLRVQGLIFYQKIHNDKVVAQKLKEFQDELSEDNLQILQNFGIKDYNILEHDWDHFEKRFLSMKMFKNVQKDERVDWSGYTRFIETNKSLTRKNMIEEMIIKAPEMFKEAEALVKLNEQPIVNKLLLWGVYTNEPMAVYLAQKLAMLTGQIIPHELALKVSKMLSYKRPLSEQFIQKCKDCLRVVGKIDREFIYSFDKEYEHILYRKHYLKYVTDKIYSKKYDNTDLEDLIANTPRQNLFQAQTKLYHDSIVQRAQLL